jgi:hypothetical protein
LRGSMAILARSPLLNRSLYSTSKPTAAAAAAAVAPHGLCVDVSDLAESSVQTAYAA